MSGAIVIEPDGEAVHERCADCAGSTRSVWGYVSSEAGARAAYFIRWTDGHLERGAQIMVSLGAWGAGSDPAQRRSFGRAVVPRWPQDHARVDPHRHPGY